MGVRGLYRLLKRFGDRCQLRSDEETVLVIDGPALTHRVWDSLDCPRNAHWDDYRSYIKELDRVMDAFTNAGLKCEIFFDGGLPYDKRLERLHRQNGIVSRQTSSPARLLVPIGQQHLAQRFDVAIVEGEADVYCTIRSRQMPKPSYVLSQDSDLLLMNGIRYVPLDTLEFRNPGDSNTPTTIIGSVYNYETLCNRFGKDIRDSLVQGLFGDVRSTLANWFLAEENLTKARVRTLIDEKYKREMDRAVTTDYDWHTMFWRGHQCLFGLFMETIIPPEIPELEFYNTPILRLNNILHARVAWLPQFVEDRTRKSSFFVSTKLRQFAYSLIIHSQETVVEVNRVGPRMKAKNVSMGDVRASDLEDVEQFLGTYSDLSDHERIFVLATRWTISNIETFSETWLNALVLTFVLLNSSSCDLSRFQSDGSGLEEASATQFAAQVQGSIYSLNMILQFKAFKDDFAPAKKYWGIAYPPPSFGIYYQQEVFVSCFFLFSRDLERMVLNQLSSEQRTSYLFLRNMIVRGLESNSWESMDQGDPGRAKQAAALAYSNDPWHIPKDPQNKYGVLGV